MKAKKNQEGPISPPSLYLMEPVISERRLAESSPPEADRAEQEGESQPFRGWKGQVFPACEPDRVTAEVFERRNNGFQHPELDFQIYR